MSVGKSLCVPLKDMQHELELLTKELRQVNLQQFIKQTGTKVTVLPAEPAEDEGTHTSRSIGNAAYTPLYCQYDQHFNSTEELRFTSSILSHTQALTFTCTQSSLVDPSPPHLHWLFKSLPVSVEMIVRVEEKKIQG